MPIRKTTTDSIGRHKITPNRFILPLTHPSCRKSLYELKFELDGVTSLIIRKIRMLASNHNPGKYCEKHTFNREKDECVFIRVSNA